MRPTPSATAIFAEAFGRDPEFFAFYRSLTAYENSLKGENSTLVITPDSEFFDYLKSDTGRPAAPRSSPWAWIALGLGLVLVIEGLVFALAPSRLDEIVEIMAKLSPEQRRVIGLVAVALGVGLVWLAKTLGV